MSTLPSQNPAPDPGPPLISHPVPVEHSPVERSGSVPAPKIPSVDAAQRREFFSDAMRETLGPLAFLLERKIHPLLAALEAIPDEAQRLANFTLPAQFGPPIQPLDQPQSRPKLPLPVVPTTHDRYLRPPGAMDPGSYETVCSRCGKCVEACPSRSIQIDDRQLIAEGYPYIIPTEQPCTMCAELACMPACPTGALKLTDRFHIKIGTAKVDHTLCLRGHGEDCTLCVDACPITKGGTSPDGKGVGGGDAIFIHPDSGKIRVRKNICTGCGLCESRCPTYPQAITITPYAPPKDPIIA